MIDAHFHAWSLARGDYGWLTPALKPIFRDVPVAEWQVLAQAQGIQGGVLVQAAPTDAETQYLLAQARLHPMVKGVVGWVDMQAPDAVAQVERLAREPLLKGLRPMLQDLTDPAWILQTSITPVLQAMAQCDLVFDALITPQHLPHMRVLIERHLDLTVVIDHGAKPTMVKEVTAEWACAIESLASTTDPSRVVCKMSGLWTQADPGSACEVVTPWCQALLRSFGPERLIWGSDWPVLDLAGCYERWRQVSLEILKNCTDGQQAAVLGGNARRIYRL